jgi:ubiquinone biosynthesis protein COQ9
MRAQEKKDQESEQQRDEFFNKLWPMVPRQQWRAKAVSEALKETRVEAAEERGATNALVLVEIDENRSNRPATPV